MLPFLQPKKMSTTVIVAHPDGKEHEEGEQPDDLQMAAEDLIHAVHMKDASAVSHALHAAFMICDAMPHEEAEEGPFAEGEV